MRRLSILLAAMPSVLLAGCACDLAPTAGSACAPAAQLVAVQPQQVQYVAAAPCQQQVQLIAAPQQWQAVPVGAAPCHPVEAKVVAAPQATAAGTQYVQVMYRTSAGQYVRAGLEVPGNLIVCFGNFLRCAMNALFPIVEPTASYAPAAVQAVQYVQVPVQAPAPAAAPLCVPAQAPAAAPARPPPPAGRWVWDGANWGWEGSGVAPANAPPKTSSMLECPAERPQVCVGDECLIPVNPYDTPPDLAARCTVIAGR